MSRFLILTYPLAGHVNPAMPIVQKLNEHGHDVLWITGCLFKDEVEATGAQHIPLPKEIDPADKDIYDIFPQLKELEGFAQVKWYIKHVFLDSAVPMIKAIDAALEYFAADVLIGDSITPGVFFKSEMADLPSVMFSDTPFSILSKDTAPYGLGIVPGRNVLTKTRDRLLNFLIHNLLSRDIHRYANNLRGSLGLAPFQTCIPRQYYEIPSLKLIIQFCTPSFEYPRSDLPNKFHYVGPVLPKSNPNYELPQWWLDLNGSEPVILINQGTVAKNLDDVIVPAIEGLKQQKMQIVAVPVHKGELGEVPDNVKAEAFVPFGNLLPHVDVMITNGGYGATQMALAHGIPLVIAGATEDKMEVAARVEWSGCGINLRKKRPSPQNFRDVVGEAISNPIYRNNAKRLQGEIAGYDAPAKAVGLLEGLCTCQV